MLDPISREEKTFTYIDGFRIMNRELTLSNSGGMLTRQISRTDKITIHFKDKIISINYKALNYINPQTNRIKYQPQRVGLRRLIEEVIGLSRRSIQSKRIEVGIDCGETVEAKADQEMIRTILRNLLNNAIKFTPREGSGLGLTLCREFIRMHKGQFEIKGEEGRGRTFTFSIEQASQIRPNGSSSFLHAGISSRADRKKRLILISYRFCWICGCCPGSWNLRFPGSTTLWFLCHAVA